MSWFREMTASVWAVSRFIKSSLEASDPKIDGPWESQGERAGS